jgi:hypothetical protein
MKPSQLHWQSPQSPNIVGMSHQKLTRQPAGHYTDDVPCRKTHRAQNIKPAGTLFLFDSFFVIKLDKVFVLSCVCTEPTERADQRDQRFDARGFRVGPHRVDPSSSESALVYQRMLRQRRVYTLPGLFQKPHCT